jgi:hypothetical protein
MNECVGSVRCKNKLEEFYSRIKDQQIQQDELQPQPQDLLQQDQLQIEYQEDHESINELSERTSSDSLSDVPE